MELERDVASQIVALLHDEDFLMFMQEAPGDYLHRARFEDFVQQRMPSCLDANTAWEFVSFMRRVAGKPTVAETNEEGRIPIEDHDFWAMNVEVLSRFIDIANRSTSSSALWPKIRLFRSRAAVLAPIVEEVHAACLRDGLNLEYETVRSLVVEGAVPASDEERVVANALAITRELDSLASEQPSEEFFTSIHARLSAGAEHLHPTAYRPPVAMIPHPLRISPDKSLAAIVDGYARPRSWGMHPTFVALINADTFWMMMPFERFNGIMEMLVRWITYARIDVPALRFVPLSSMRLAWERRLIGPPEAPMRFGEALSISSFGVDSTPYLLQTTKFILQGLERIERTIDRLEDENSRCKTFIEQDGRFALRQKRLLTELVDDPGRTIDVVYYERRFDIATSTARSDLMKLVSTQCLMTEYQGKKQVFWIRPDLYRALQHRPT